MGLIKICWFLIMSLSLLGTISAQSITLASEIEKLGRLSQNPAQKYESLLSLARLYQLSGDKEKALESWLAASYARPGSRDDWALLEAVKLWISMGEYDKARTELRSILVSSNNQDIQQSAWGLIIQLEAFKNKDSSELSNLVGVPVYAGIQSRILYTLWKISQDNYWKTMLINTYPRSPEAEIAKENIGIIAVTTPQWLFLPPREDDISSQASPVLQTGLFSQEANAKAMVDRLARAGFSPELSHRSVNGTDFWAVYVIPGPDINQTISQLRIAGFESFPVNQMGN
jgi:tetratricopeptide (TPR) repeat protein